MDINDIIHVDFKKYKILKLIDGLSEIEDFLDDGYHNSEIGTLCKIRNELLEQYDHVDKDKA